MDLTISCEICNDEISFENYIEHCETCYIQTSFINRRLNRDSYAHHITISMSRVDTPFDIEHTLNQFEMNEQLESMNGGSVNVSANDIESCFETIEYDTSLKCTLCLDDSRDKTYVKTCCQHIFCRSCITRWLNMRHKCPICQHDFNE